jgi:hypothetical protein
VSETLKKGTRVTGVDRSKLATLLGKRYDSGESIRSLAASTGRSYGFIHRILTETGVRLRGRSGSSRSGSARVKGGYRRGGASGSGQPQIPIQIFLADAAPGPAVEEAVREVLLLAGVEDVLDEELVIRSWYRSLTGLMKRAADSDAAAEARRAIELQVLDRFQAGIDGVTGDAVAKLITALNQTSGAVIQVGSVLLVKVDETIVVRQLTSREMIHWQHNPGLFKDPATALAELQRANQDEPRPVPPNNAITQTPVRQPRTV